MVLCPVKVFVLEDSNINFFAHWQPFRTYFFVKKNQKNWTKIFFTPNIFVPIRKWFLTVSPVKIWDTQEDTQEECQSVFCQPSDALTTTTPL